MKNNRNNSSNSLGKLPVYSCQNVTLIKIKLPVQNSNLASALARYLTVTEVFVMHSSERKGGSAITISKYSRRFISESDVVCPNDIGFL